MLVNKIIPVIVFLLLSACLLNGQEATMERTSPDGRYALFSSKKDLDNFAFSFESFVVDKIAGDTIILANNYREDLLPPNWFWDKDSQYLIFEGNEHGNVAKLQVWDLEDRFLLYELRGSIPVERDLADQFWDSQQEVLAFYVFDQLKSLNLKTRKVKNIGALTLQDSFVKE